MRNAAKFNLLFLSFFCLLSVSGCTALLQSLTNSKAREGASTSLVDFLYPDGEIPDRSTDAVPTLKLPLDIGIAFIPAKNSQTALSEAHKMQLLEQIRSSFKNKPYIRNITPIPETYFRGTAGFTGINQISKLFSSDLIALVSYDQSVSSSDNKRSFLYWTIAGAYLIEGSQNNIQTFVDLAVIDPKTKQILLRAPGIDVTHFSSTLADNKLELNRSQTASFDKATAQLNENLHSELQQFQQQITKDKSVRFSKRAGYSGGGTLSEAGFCLFSLLAICRRKIGDITRCARSPSHFAQNHTIKTGMLS